VCRGRALVSEPLSPQEIYELAEEEGRRRLSMPPLELVSTGFIAGVTIMFGITALGVLHALVEPDLGTGLAKVAGGAGFAIGLVLVVAGRTELFTENFFDPVAAAIDHPARTVWLQLVRLWIVILVLNLLGGAVLAAVLMVDGALPDGAPAALTTVAQEIAAKSAVATLARAVLAGAVLTLLSYLLHAVESSVSRIVVTALVGFLVAVGPFDHVVVSALHLLFGIWAADAVGYTDLASNLVLSAVGNVVGGVALMTLTHTAQVKGARS
jgi:formate-nitrite transporter family protein